MKNGFDNAYLLAELNEHGSVRTNPDFVTFTTTHDLELVCLADDKTFVDVQALWGGEDRQ